MVPGYAMIGRINTILNIIVPAVPHPQGQFQQKATRFIFGQMMLLQIITKNNVAGNWCGKLLSIQTLHGNNFLMNV
jgi:hypothetical protein